MFLSNFRQKKGNECVSKNCWTIPFKKAAEGLACCFLEPAGRLKSDQDSSTVQQRGRQPTHTHTHTHCTFPHCCPGLGTGMRLLLVFIGRWSRWLAALLSFNARLQSSSTQHTTRCWATLWPVCVCVCVCVCVLVVLAPDPASDVTNFTSSKHTPLHRPAWVHEGRRRWFWMKRHQLPVLLLCRRAVDSLQRRLTSLRLHWLLFNTQRNSSYMSLTAAGLLGWRHRTKEVLFPAAAVRFDWYKGSFFFFFF